MPVLCSFFSGKQITQTFYPNSNAIIFSRVLSQFPSNETLRSSELKSYSLKDRK